MKSKTTFIQAYDLTKKNNRMKRVRIILLGSLLLASFSGTMGANPSKLPPASAFNMREMKDPSTLDLKILADEIVPASKGNTETIRRIHLEFFSQNWGGEEVRHLAKVYLPAGGIAESKRGLAVINQGGSSNVKDGLNLEQEYGAMTALKLGIPSMLLQSNMPGDHWGVKGQGPVRRYTAAKFFETGDPGWIHWIALAKIYMRAMTVLEKLEDVQATRFVLGGSSKRAQSIWIAAAVDDRIRGIVTIARPGNFLHLIQSHSPSPGGLPNPEGPRKIHEGWKYEYMAHIEDMYTTRGYEYMAYVDPYLFLSRIKVPVMYLIGTNDNLFNSFDDHGFYPYYEGDKSFAYVPNYRHGMGTSAHVKAYRAWIAHCFWGRPTTTVTALESTDNGKLNVSALVNSQAEITSVRLYYCFLKAKEFNDDKDSYQSVSMKQVNNTSLWNATLPPSESDSGEVYWYIESKDRSDGLESIATTLLKRSHMLPN